MTRIAFIGLGAMGVRMARHLVDAHELTVHNRTRERATPLLDAGARWADSPREAAAGADVVISMVTDDAAAEQVWLHPEDGAVAGLHEGALALECSTVTPDSIRRLAEATSVRGAQLLDAPVVGSTPQAEARQLAFLVGGSDAALARATPLMQLMGGKVIHAGPSTHGAVLKLVVNALFASQVALMAELLQMVAGQGLDPAAVLQQLSQLPVASPAALGTAALMLAGDHAPRFPVDLVVKDLSYAASLGDLPVTTAARARFQAASDAGRGSENLTSVHRPAP